MAIIITYDMPVGHTDFKTAMFKLGYKDRIPGENCETIYFPNTTLFHPSKKPSDARADAQAQSKLLKLELERCVATVWEDWSVICGTAFK